VPERAIRYRWEWSFRSTPEELWPLVSDTNRFNFETGAPRVEALGTDESGTRRLRLVALGRPVEYDEEPFEWVRPERFAVRRRYHDGPIATLVARLELEPGNGGSRLVYEVEVEPRTALGRAGIPVAIGRIARARMDEAFQRYDRELAAGSSVPVAARSEPRLAPGGLERLSSLRAELVAGGAEPTLVERLATTVARSEDLSLARLRPYALADAWAEKRRSVLELCLAATRCGLLESRWELLCPLCRGATQSARSLSQVERHGHCDSCDVDVEADLERSLELVFRPSPAVREVKDVAFCVGGPGVTPHVVAQQLLGPGESRTLRVPLEPGRYRIRARGARGSEGLVVAPEETAATVQLSNSGEGPQLYVVERTAWSDQAATAAEVTALQAFRDLFASEALRPGEELGVRSLTVAFTDLRGSTRLYREIGDAPAYGSVVGHFDVLRSAIADEDGALVKTIGDAVMAVFRRPVSSLRAMLAAQARLADPSEGGRSLLLKAGIHEGPCITVTMNDRLDYFGSTVNAAARIVDLSSGEDVVISGSVLADPEVAELLAGDELSLEPVEATLRGFDEERFELWRVRRRA
jgi:class 3 adenylate cyclase